MFTGKLLDSRPIEIRHRNALNVFPTMFLVTFYGSLVYFYWLFLLVFFITRFVIKHFFEQDYQICGVLF